MTLQDFYQLYSAHPQTQALLGLLRQHQQQHLLLPALRCAAQPLLISELFRQLRRTMLLMLSSQEQAEYMLADLRKIAECPDDDTTAPIKFFPTSYRKRQTQVEEAYAIQRTEVLSALNSSSEPLLIVSYANAIAEQVVAADTLTEHTISLTVNQHIEQSALIDMLVREGFVKQDFVYEPGQFSQRGGIIDVFSYSDEYPYRIDFFGDEIDTIRLFDIETQLSKQKIDKVNIICQPSTTTQTTTALSHYLPSDTLFLSDDLSLVRYQVSSSLSDTAHLWQPLFDGQLTTIEMSPKSLFDNATTIAFHTTPQPLFHKNFELLRDTLLQKQTEGYRVYIASDSVKQTDRIEAILSELGLDHSFTPVNPTLHEGFDDADAHLLLLTDHQIFERYHRVSTGARQVRRSKAVITLKELNQLQVGDYVVHVDHGIGRFGGLVNMTTQGRTQEMIKLLYRDNDVLYVSIHNLHRISKYKGKDGSEPHISKLGGGQWERIKERTKQKVKDIARDLIRLYAQRQSEQGYRFQPDTYLQHEMEASFLYEDTPDQQKATIDVKHDMESAVPMDRLICGDVGFGKTEIAMRAAFKAATDGKQVAVLVPTTVLALQHYNTFSERFKQMPVRVEYLSRAKSQKETKEVLQQLERGEIDIIIGTHKLVGKQVRFHDLGLLIIDEEQKFGVATKERLRQLRTNIDTLTLTATPIPRTLQFSLLGARDLSVMTTPPPNRYPIDTELITPDDEDIIREAINLELQRNGQVFVINNLVQTLPVIEKKIRRLCPEARIAVAHGQMPTEQVEQVLTDFINYDYDILIATSIIESGVDIPNVNTIIINAANRFGLSDLHQLRGRVGRSNRKAYCYLIAPANELLTPDARRRLQAIETFAELGSGFHIAMQDLDIRGAGNMLGAEQSGFIAELGYETYQRILQEAVIELREEEGLDSDDSSAAPAAAANQQWVSDSQLETDLELGLPVDYVESVSERIALYRELDSLTNEQQLQEFQHRLIDRFGAMPDKAEELMNVVRMRWLCMSLGIEKVVLRKGQIILYFPQNTDSPYYQSDTFDKVIAYVMHNPRRCRFSQDTRRRSVIIDNTPTITSALTLLQQINQPGG